MNSLPFIPHHLFIAAIGNDGRAGQKPPRPEPRFVGPAGRTDAVAVEVLDNRRPPQVGMTRPLRTAGTLVTT